MLDNLMYGCDPEVFLKKDGEFVPSTGLIGGTKEKPRMLSKHTTDRQSYLRSKSILALEDNVMVEFNTHPKRNLENWWGEIEKAKEVLEHNLKGYELAIVPSAKFKKKDLQSKQAQEFGCDPDYCIWTQEQNTPPSAKATMRYAGGHIHIGIPETDDFFENCFDLIKYLDLTVGVGSLFVDKDDERRKAYGKAGNFRIKSYGVEYRSPSNFWLKDKETFDKLSKWITLGVNLMNDKFPVDKYKDRILQSMNDLDRKEGEKIVKELKLL